MKQPPEYVRLVFEFVVLAALIELALMLALPLILPPQSGWMEAAVDTVALAGLLGAAFWWRLRHHAGDKLELATASTSHRQAVWISLVVLVLCLVINGLVSYQVFQENKARVSEKFERLTTRVEADLQRRVRLPLFGLLGAAGVFNASEQLSAEEFRQYVNSLDMARTFPGVRGLGFIVPLERAGQVAFVKAQRKAIDPGFDIKTSGSESTMYVVDRIEPLAQNREALGFDLSSEPVRMEAIRRAVQSGDLTLSGPASLVQDKRHRLGVLYMLPVYKEVSRPGEAPHKRLQGFFYAPLLIDELLDGLPSEGDGQLDIRITDVSGTHEQPDPMYEAVLRSDKPRYEGSLSRRATITIAGRAWVVDMRPNARFTEGMDQQEASWMAVGGVVLSLVVSLATWLMVSGRRRAESMAQQMTAELDMLAQVVRLTQSAVIISDAEHRVTWVNEGFTRMYGYTFEEAHGTVLRNMVFSPNTPAENQRLLYNCIDAGVPCRTEVINRAKDGHEFWVETEVQPQLDANGKLVGFIKINQNVSELKDAKRRLENAVSETEALLKTLHGHTIVSVADRSGRITDVNEAFCRISGYTREELLGQTHAIINSGLHSPEFWRDMWRTIGHGNSWKGEVCNRSKQGHLYWVDSIIAPILNADGRIEKYVSIRMDVTPRKLTEQRLRANQAFLDRVSRTARIGGWQLDLDTQEVEWTGLSNFLPGADNDAKLDMDGAMAMIQPPGRQRINEAITNAVRHHQSWDTEVEAIGPTGKRVWLRSVGEAEFEDGLAVRLVGALQDVTERREAQQRLDETTNLLRNVLHSASAIAVVAIDTQGIINVFNRGAELLLGYLACEVVGQHSPLLFLEAGPSSGIDWTLQSLLGEQGAMGQACERAYVREDGSRVPVSQLVTEIRTEDGALQGYLLLAQDVTERLRYEASLQSATDAAEAASAAKGQFLANMSHEIRTPMNAVLGLLRLLGKTQLDSAQRGYVDKTERAARSLLALLNDVLDLSKIDAGKMHLDAHAFRMKQLMGDIGVILEASIGDKPVKLQMQIDADVPPILVGDDIRLQQVLMNLGSNAVKFTGQGEVVLGLKLLGSEGERARVRFWVRDTGIGIPLDAQERVFEVFTQAEGSTTRRFGGTGLGLPISKHLVNMMGGDLQLESRLGEGSHFWFDVTLGVGSEDAVQERSALAPRRAAPGQARLRGMHILLVEDNATNRQVAGELLRDEGAEVAEAHNGLEGVQRALATPAAFDAVLMDIQMPVMDGLTATRQIRAELGDACPRIIAMTANVSGVYRDETRAAGMVAHVGKPFELDELVAVLLDEELGTVARSVPERVQELADAIGPVEGIDVPSALARFGWRERVYRQLLASFIREIDGAEALMSKLWQSGDHEQLARWLHTLKGLSGTLGHGDLRACFENAERGAREAAADASTDMPDWLQGLLDQVSAARTLVQGLVDTLQALDAEGAAGPVPSQALDKIAFEQAVMALQDMLERADMAAMDAFDALQRTHSPAMPGQLDALGEAIGRLDFDAAAAQCRSLAAELAVT